MKYLPHGSQFHFGVLPAVSGITGNETTDVITANAHGMKAGDGIVFSSLTGGAGLNVNQLYYLRNVTTNTFELANVPGGALVNFTAVLTAATATFLRAIGGLITIGFPDAEKEEAETTDTYSAGSREFIPGLRDFGSSELACRHDPEDKGQQALDANFLALKDVVPCWITLPDGATSDTSFIRYNFTGFVMAGPQGDLALAESEAAEVSYTVRITGLLSKSQVTP